MSGLPELSPADGLRELAEYCERTGLKRDVYGEGDGLRDFEKRVADFLGYEAAVFMPSGTMAQQIALRIWADRAKNPQVGFHATSHLEANEEHAYRHLHGLEASLLGQPLELLRAQDLLACPQKLSSVLVELPMRRLGGILPEWEELEAMKAAAREKGMKLHLDGARLWEAGPYYTGRKYSEICVGFDSTYVSFYKGLGGMTGAMLAGPADFVAESRVWLRRHGGNLYQMTPYWLSAKRGFEMRLGEFGPRLERARKIAQALAGVRGLSLRPKVPQTSMMHVLIEAPIEKLLQARDRIAFEDRFWLAGRFFPTERADVSLVEIVVAEGTMKLGDAEITQAFEKLVRWSV
jgi:threonine aldolase